MNADPEKPCIDCGGGGFAQQLGEWRDDIECQTCDGYGFKLNSDPALLAQAEMLSDPYYATSVSPYVVADFARRVLALLESNS